MGHFFHLLPSLPKSMVSLQEPSTEPGDLPFTLWPGACVVQQNQDKIHHLRETQAAKLGPPACMLPTQAPAHICKATCSV